MRHLSQVYQVTERLRLSVPTAQVSVPGGAQPQPHTPDICFVYSHSKTDGCNNNRDLLLHPFILDWSPVSCLESWEGKKREGNNNQKKKANKWGFSSSSITPLRTNPLTKTDWCTRSSLPMFKLACDQAEVSSSCFYSKEKNSESSGIKAVVTFRPCKIQQTQQFWIEGNAILLKAAHLPHRADAWASDTLQAMPR